MNKIETTTIELEIPVTVSFNLLPPEDAVFINGQQITQDYPAAAEIKSIHISSDSYHLIDDILTKEQIILIQKHCDEIAEEYFQQFLV